MGLFGGSEGCDEIYVPHPARATWQSLRDAVSAHPSVTGTRFNDLAMRAEFKTSATYATYGQNLTAVVTANGYSTRIEISGAAKRPSFGGRDRARIHKIAAELFTDVTARLADAPRVDATPHPEHRFAPISGKAILEEISKFELLRARGFITADEFDDHKTWLLRGW